MDWLVPLITALVASAATLAVQKYIIGELKERVKVLETKMEDVIQQRNDDVLTFSQALAAFNTTLAKIDLTLKNLDRTIFTVQEIQKEHGKDIKDLIRQNGTL